MFKKSIYIVLFCLSTFASEIAIVKNITGKTDVKRADKIIPLQKGFKLKEGDIIITKAKSSIGIMFKDGTRISLGSKTIFSINKYLFRPQTNEYNIDLKMDKGKAAFSSGKIGKLSPKSVKFRIPQGIVGIRGTRFLAEVK